MKTVSNIIRAAIAVAAILVFAAFFGIRLMKLQVVDGEKYLSLSKSSTTAYQAIPAARGEIVDRDGEPLVENRASSQPRVLI